MVPEIGGTLWNQVLEGFEYQLISWILFTRQEKFWGCKISDPCVRKTIYKIIKVILVYKILICVQSSRVYIAFLSTLKMFNPVEWSR